jgi:protein-S-isoprenylcysteine O-methyltransferase Ste14
MMVWIRKMKNFNIPPVWTLFSIVSSGLLHFVYPLTLFQFRAIDTGVIAIGVYLILATPIWFKRKSTTIIPRRKPTTLIVDGPFKMSRNPMYLGMVMLSFGVGLSLGSIQAVIPSILLFFFLKKNYVLPEERKLVEAMGKEAEQYFQKTGRWIWFL